jgi:hypothetical protein
LLDSSPRQFAKFGKQPLIRRAELHRDFPCMRFFKPQDTVLASSGPADKAIK